MSFEVTRSDKEIADLENLAWKGWESGSKYPGMSFEDGIKDTLAWLRGDDDDAPLP